MISLGFILSVTVSYVGQITIYWCRSSIVIVVDPNTVPLCDVVHDLYQVHQVIRIYICIYICVVVVR